MCVIWLGILLIYGFSNSWQIEPLFWWMLVPQVLQDMYDGAYKSAMRR